MHCDQVFDVLTQGPFPTGESIDARVERHIACCHECRQMAEALRPAVDLFHESIVEFDQVPLPEYRGQAGDASVATLPEVVNACLNSTELHSRVTAPSRRGTCSSFLRQGSYIAATSLAIFGLILLGIAAMPDSKSALNQTPADGQVSNEKTVDRTAGIALAQLSEACLQDAGLRAGAVTPAHRSATVSKSVQCCTLCHNAANRHGPKIDTIAMLDKSCSGCHAR